MKILSKLVVLSLVIGTFTLSACSDDDNYTSGNKTNSDSLNVYFSTPENINLASTSKSFNVFLVRSTKKDSLIVPLTLASGNGYDSKGEAIFSVPSKVKFKIGQDTTVVTVQCTDSIMASFNYYVVLSIPDAYTTQYKKKQAGMPRAELNIVKTGK